MPKTAAYAAATPKTPLAPTTIDRREPGPEDVLMDVLFCGVCHSDLHQTRDEWGSALFPMVPGHEVVGRVSHVGARVTKFKVGDIAGVGCFVDSCRSCEFCTRSLEMFCDKGVAWSYNSTEMDRTTRTYGGYSKQIVVADRYALKIPAGLDPAVAAPLLCAGITTYSPLRHWNCTKGKRVAVVGLGGLGHMAVKLAVSMGAEVTVLSTSRAKAGDAGRLGATGFEVTTEPGAFEKMVRRFDLIIDTVSAKHDYNLYLSTLRPQGALVLVGAPPEHGVVEAFSLINGNKSFAGSNIGGIAETQEMLDYCAARRVLPDIELIPIQKINDAYERLLKGDVRYRFVIDMATLQA